jgi:membrane protein
MKHIWRMLDRGWIGFWEVWTLSDKTHLSLIAAGIAFFGMFAMFPAIAALIAIFGLVSDPVVVETQLSTLDEIIPPGAYELLYDQVHRLVTAQTDTLGWTTVLSLVLALWSARAGVASLVQGLNAIHRIPNRDGIWHNLVSMTLTLSLIAIAMTALTAVIVAPIALTLAPAYFSAGWIAETIRWSVAILSLLVALGILYRFGPNGTIKMAWVTPGAVLVIVLWIAASVGFSLYVANFDSYNRIYGSIGAVIALMMWLYISAYLILLGAALNEVIYGDGTSLDHGM